jgi:hypothetical protein
MRKTLVALVCLILVIPVAYVGFVAFGALEQGYRWSEMDWNSDGKTTPSEFLTAADIGKREAISAPKGCIEYYAYKDGMPVRIDCTAPTDKAVLAGPAVPPQEGAGVAFLPPAQGRPALQVRDILVFGGARKIEIAVCRDLKTSGRTEVMPPRCPKFGELSFYPAREGFACDGKIEKLPIWWNYGGVSGSLALRQEDIIEAIKPAYRHLFGSGESCLPPFLPKRR